MDNNTVFFHDAAPASPLPPTYTKPTDDFRPLDLSPFSILYLAVITPHTDKYQLHGPVTSFTQLLPTISDIVSNSPSAIDKLSSLQYTAPDVWGAQEPNEHFTTHGFTTFLVQGQRDTYTVLHMLHASNPPVHALLPAPVFTITRHGPLVHTYTGLGTASKLGPAVGYAATSALVGSFVGRGEARDAARSAMEGLLEGQGDVVRVEDWGDGGGVLLAMQGERRWEVRVYMDEALRRAREGADEEGEGVGWRF